MRFLPKVLFFPKWVWLYAFIAWFCLEIAGASISLAKINLTNLFFSFSFYLVSLAIVINLVLKKGYSIWGLLLLGLIFGFSTNVFYIKAPLIKAIPFSLKAGIVGVIFPYFLVNILSQSTKIPFLGKKGILLSFAYLAILYFSSFSKSPLSFKTSFIQSLIILGVLIFILIKFGKIADHIGDGFGLRLIEKIAMAVVSIILTFATNQYYAGILIIFLWLLIRQKVTSLKDIYFITILFVIFDFFLVKMNKGALLSKISANYPYALILGVILLVLTLRKRKTVLG